MTKSQLKEILRPMVKELFLESFLENLKTIVSESVKAALSTVPVQVLSENLEKKPCKVQAPIKSSKTLDPEYLANRNRLENTIGLGPGVFSGTKPLHDSPLMTENVGGSSFSVPGPLSGIDPNDEGVDISALLGKNWKFGK